MSGGVSVSGESITASSGRKRPRNEGEGDDQPLQKIGISIQNQEGREMMYKVEPDTKLSKVFRSFCKVHGMEYGTVSFIYKRNRVNPKNTPAELNMKNGAIIFAGLKKDGG